MATTIVAVKTATDVVVGADSKATSLDLKSSRSACKIGQASNFLFAIEGHSGDQLSGFNPFVSGLEVGNGQGSILEKTQRLAAMLKDPLTISLTILLQTNAKVFKPAIEAGPPLTVLCFGVEKDTARLYQLTFKASAVPTIKIGDEMNYAVQITSEITEVVVSPPADKAVVILGFTDEAKTTLTNVPTFWNVGLIDGVRWLVTLEAVANTQYIGTPVDLVRIDKTGVHWVERKPECEEKKGGQQRGNPLRRP